MSNIFSVEVVQDNEELLNDSSASILWEPAIVWLSLLCFKMSMKAFSLYALHHKVHTLRRRRTIDAFV